MKPVCVNLGGYFNYSSRSRSGSNPHGWAVMYDRQNQDLRTQLQTNEWKAKKPVISSVKFLLVNRIKDLLIWATNYSMVDHIMRTLGEDL